MLTAERLRELLEYAPTTGLFRWRLTRPGRGAKDWFAGSPHGSGYLVICVEQTNYRAHRLAWLHVKGAWPLRTIDHKNRLKADNRFDNLRDRSQRLNNQNRDGGVERRETKGGTRWRARISHFGRLVTVGTFDSEAAAEAARVDAKQTMHPGYISQKKPSDTLKVSDSSTKSIT